MQVCRHPKTAAATSSIRCAGQPGRAHAPSLHGRCNLFPESRAWVQQGTCSSMHWQQHCSTQPRCEAGPHKQTTHPLHHQRTRQMCASSAADNPGMPPATETESLHHHHHQQQQQQQQPGLPRVQGNTSSSSAAALGRQYASVVMPPLGQQEQLKAHPLLAWLPPPLLLHLQSLMGFLLACWELLPQFISPGVPEALRRLVLVLGASLLMIVVVSTIDSAWLYLYLLNARQIATAA